MVTQLYLTLPSNSSLEYFPKNTVEHFKVKLAEAVELNGEWEVALHAEIHFPRSWSTIQEGNQQTLIYKLSPGHTAHDNDTITIPKKIIRLLNSR